MFNFLYLVLAAATSGAVASNTRFWHVDDLINTTVCAMEKKIDVNENRIPKNILVLKCAAETDKWCKLNDLPGTECCHAHRGDLFTECIEITETARVIYRDTNTIGEVDVSMGCVCAMTYGTNAPAPGGPWRRGARP